MNQIDLKGRVAVITGGAQGIGYAVAERMLNSGAEVVLWDIDAARLAEAENALAKLGRLGKVTTSIVELTMAADIDAATADAARAHGRIDILVNNAGITGGNAPTWALEPAVWRQVLEVNLVAPYLTCRAVAPVAVNSASKRVSKAIDRNSKDYIELKKAGVNFFKTPDAILRAQLASWDKIMEKKSAENALFKKALDSQKAFAQRAGAWQNDYLVDFKMAYNYYFAKK